MLTIPIQVSGDVWYNQETVKQLLDQTQPGQQIMLDLCSEGPSLHLLGIVNLVDRYSLDVSVTRWSNSVEQVPYQRVLCNSNSHFFPMSHHYWVENIPNIVPAKFRFGLFQGRGTASRNRILHDAATLWQDNFLLSKMSSLHGNNWGTESLEGWFSDVEYAQNWLNSCTVTSLDSHVIQDQYQYPETSAAQMATSLLQYYPQFNIELVCETYTLGTTFFPTEKTVRPIVGDRPFIVYGPKNYLNNLQQQGFQTFGNLWDESYDQLEGPDRWQAMSQLITELVSMSDSAWKTIVDQSIHVTQHNKSVLRQNIRDFKRI